MVRRRHKCALEILSTIFIYNLIGCTSTARAVAGAESCGNFSDNWPEPYVPWAATIIVLNLGTFQGAILDSTTIITDDAAFYPFVKRDSKKTKIVPFANYTVRVGYGKHKSDYQRLEVSYIKLHPRFPPLNQYWPKKAHQWAIIYLRNPINMTNNNGNTHNNPIHSLCLPNPALMKQLNRVTNKTMGDFSGIVISGSPGKTRHTGSILMRVQLNTVQECRKYWKTRSETKSCPCAYARRACGFMSEPPSTKTYSTCIRRTSGSVLRHADLFYLVGFLNYVTPYESANNSIAVCNTSSLVYISLLMPDDLNWIQNDTMCGPDKFTCDNGNCIELHQACDGAPNDCADGSDETSVSCSVLVKCETNQFTCSTGLALYCIPVKNQITGKVAANCDGVTDCPRGAEDEDAKLCGNLKFSTILITTASISGGTLLIVVTAVGYSCRLRRRSNKINLTEEDLLAFFEGGRNVVGDVCNFVDEYEEVTDPNPNQLELSTIRLRAEELVKEEEEADKEIKYFCPENIRRLGYGNSNSFDFDITKCTLGQEIASGAYGIIKHGYLEEGTGGGRSRKEVVFKIPNPTIGEIAFKTLLLELKILKYLHDIMSVENGNNEDNGCEGQNNIIRFLGADTKRIRKGILYVAFEYYKNGSIRDYVGKNRKEFIEDILDTSILQNTHKRDYYDVQQIQEPIASHQSNTQTFRIHCATIQLLIRWASQIASGMKFLSEQKIIHLDLAARNSLLDDNLIAKIGDFGLSRKLYENVDYKIKRTDDLPWRWLALEILQYNKCSLKSDIWSYGVMLWELFSLCEEPWGGRECTEQFLTQLKNGERLSIPKYANWEIYQKMFSCWNANSDARPSFHELKEYFTSLINVTTTTEL